MKHVLSINLEQKPAAAGSGLHALQNSADPGHHDELSLVSQLPSRPRPRTRPIHFIFVVLVLLMGLTSDDKAGPERPKSTRLRKSLS